MGQERDVLAPLAQGRQRHREDVDAVVKILAEHAGRHALLEVAVGGGDQPDVDLGVAVVADAPELLRLQHAQDLHLQRERHLADLVEEQRPAVGRREQAFAVLGGVGEGALDVAEQLVLEQALRDGGAVDHHERALVALRQVVDGARDQLLAGAALAVDRDGDVGRRHHGDALVEVLDPRGAADDDVALARAALVVAIDSLPVAGLAIAQRALDPQAQLGAAERLGDEVERAQPHRLDRDLARIAAGHDDHARVNVPLVHLAQHVDPAHPRHEVVEQHDVEAAAVALRIEHGVDRVLAVVERGHFCQAVAQHLPDLLGGGRLIIDDEQTCSQHIETLSRASSHSRPTAVSGTQPSIPLASRMRHQPGSRPRRRTRTPG